MFKIHQRAKFQAIDSMHSSENARKPQIWPVLLSQNCAKIRKIMVMIHQHVKFQANPSMLSPANSRKPLRTDGQTGGRTDGRTDWHAVKRLRLVGWTNRPMYRSKEGISGFGRTDGRTDGQPENIMPPAPKGGGIRIETLVIWDGTAPIMTSP